MIRYYRPGGHLYDLPVIGMIIEALFEITWICENFIYEYSYDMSIKDLENYIIKKTT